MCRKGLSVFGSTCRREKAVSSVAGASPMSMYPNTSDPGLIASSRDLLLAQPCNRISTQQKTNLRMAVSPRLSAASRFALPPPRASLAHERARRKSTRMRLARAGGKVHSVARIAKRGANLMLTFFLIIHGLLAVALLG